MSTLVMTIDSDQEEEKVAIQKDLKGMAKKISKKENKQQKKNHQP